MNQNNEIQSNAERFIIAFAKIEKALNRITKRPEYVPFRLNARISARYNPAVKNHLEDICDFAGLRNAIVHTRDGKSEIVAEPSDAITRDIERVAELLDKDRNVLQFASSPVIFGKASETIVQHGKRMYEHHTSIIPLYDDGKFSGLLTLSQILTYVVINGNYNGTAKDVLGVSKSEEVVFISSQSDIQTVIELYEKYVKDWNHAPIILVTKNGTKDEEPLGMITPYDLNKIITFLA